MNVVCQYLIVLRRSGNHSSIIFIFCIMSLWATSCSKIALIPDKIYEKTSSKIKQTLVFRVNRESSGCAPLVKTVSINGIPLNYQLESEQESFFVGVEGMVRPGDNSIMVDGDFSKYPSIQITVIIREEVYSITGIKEIEIGRIVLTAADIGVAKLLRVSNCISIAKQKELYFAKNLQPIGVFTENDKVSILQRLNALAVLYQEYYTTGGSAEIAEQILSIKDMPVQIANSHLGTSNAIHKAIGESNVEYFGKYLKQKGKAFKVLPRENMRFNVGERAVLVCGNSDLDVGSREYLIHSKNPGEQNWIGPAGDLYMIFYKEGKDWKVFRTYSVVNGY